MLRLLRPFRGRTATPGGRRLGRGLAVAVALVALTPAVASALPIEDFAPYQPQTNCSPNAKPGTLKLSTWLQKTYPGSGSLGISRSCKDGGVSEHKEGRAFDWAVSVYSARDRAYVQDFFNRIFATDSEGNADALARRMGIMYLIWNDHIYSSYYGFRARDYTPCKVMSTCSDTLRHRNHVHISLSRSGGAGLTSWYTGVVGSTAPDNGAKAPRTSRGVLDLTRTPYARLTVPVTGSRLTTAFKLRKGTSYKITAAGLYGFGAPTDVADASCSWSATAGTWRSSPSSSVAAAHGTLDLLVNGARMSVSSCSSSHVYTKVVRPTRTATMSFRVANTATGADGTLVVTVSRRGTDVTKALPTYPSLADAPTASEPQPGTGLLAETVDVPATSTSVLTTGAAEKGATYRVTVSGTVDLGGGVQSDGRCVGLAGGWWPQASLDRRFPSLTHARLYVDGQPFAGEETSGSTLCEAREHVADVTASRAGRMELALWDPLKRTDDTGSLSVQVQRLTPVATPTKASSATPTTTAAWTQARDVVSVPASSPQGVVSTMRLRKDQKVDLVVTGTQHSNGVDADSSCVGLASGWAALDPAVATGQDPLNLWVDGAAVAWRANGVAGACSADHTYTLRFTATKDGPLRFAVLDLDHSDNTGTLAVTMTRVTAG